MLITKSTDFTIDIFWIFIVENILLILKIHSHIPSLHLSGLNRNGTVSLVEWIDLLKFTRRYGNEHPYHIRSERNNLKTICKKYYYGALHVLKKAVGNYLKI